MTKMTEAQKRAALKYQKKLGQISIRLPKDELAKYKQAASAVGMPFRAWVLSAMASQIRSCGHPRSSAAAGSKTTAVRHD